MCLENINISNFLEFQISMDNILLIKNKTNQNRCMEKVFVQIGSLTYQMTISIVYLYKLN